MARAQATTDHEVIRRWIEAHNGHPSVVRATKGRKKGSSGLLRVDFDEAEDALEEVSWDDFFETFDQNELAFLYQDEKDSRFHKFVSRDTVDESGSEGGAEEESSTRRSAKSTTRGSTGGKTRQATPAEEEEAEEIDEEDLEEEEEEEDEDEDFDEDDEDEDEADDEDEDFDEDEDDEDEDEDEDDEDEEDEPPSRGKKR